jgi:hypothetical protein
MRRPWRPRGTARPTGNKADNSDATPGRYTMSAPTKAKLIEASTSLSFDNLLEFCVAEALEHCEA